MSGRVFLVDTEPTGKTPYSGVMVEFGVVDLETRRSFYGHLYDFTPHPENPALPVVVADAEPNPWFESTGVRRNPAVAPRDVFAALSAWLATFDGRPVFVSDNPGFDWMWIADGFDRAGLDNPFGHSSRRIGDFAAGLAGDWRRASAWKRLRRTPHDHTPVNDSLGNAEALDALLRSTRG